jgi:DNA topoisomerase-3
MFKRTQKLLCELKKALCVSEKPSVARTITEILSNRNFKMSHSHTKYHPVFQFETKLKDENFNFTFTSGRGHLMNYETSEKFRIWKLEEIEQIFDSKLERTIDSEIMPICKNIESYAKYLLDKIRKADLLILWLDCDREGENICFEVIEIAKKANPKIQIKRAHFSALTKNDIIDSLENLKEPNKNISDGVDMRMRIDLLIGAAFTRLQTLTFGKILLGKSGFLSYGPCQFPTLNFIVERADKIRNFQAEKFYTLDLKVNKKGTIVNFTWNRNRLFDENIVSTLKEKALEGNKGKAKVISVTNEDTVRYRPIPLNTVEFQKLASRKLKITSHVAMSFAEKLYQKGYISYPRTETQKYSINQNLKRIVETLSQGSYDFSKYAKGLITSGHQIKPRFGKLDDKAHPPIHPVKLVAADNLLEIERKIYELICIHFLASVSPDAKAKECNVEINCGDEIFKVKGLNITDQGYLKLYQYETWEDNQIPIFKPNEEVDIESLDVKESLTQSPSFLTESELISLMDKYGIGTDATIHDHIKTIKDRSYAVQYGSILKPTLAGLALIKAYAYIGVDLYKPYLRAAMERDISEVCNGKKDYNTMLAEMTKEMKILFSHVFNKIEPMTKFLKKYLSENIGYEKEVGIKISTINNKALTEDASNTSEEKLTPDELVGTKIGPNCPKCNFPLHIHKSNKLGTYFISCSNYPKCKNIISLNFAKKISKLDQACKNCESDITYEIHTTKTKYINCLSTCFEKKNFDLKESSLKNEPTAEGKKASTKPRVYNKKTKTETELKVSDTSAPKKTKTPKATTKKEAAAPKVEQKKEPKATGTAKKTTKTTTKTKNGDDFIV